MAPIITQHIYWDEKTPKQWNLSQEWSSPNSHRGPVIYLRCNSEDFEDGMMAFVDFVEQEEVTSEKY